MKRLYWGLGMTVVVALALLILWPPNEVSWTWNAESKPAGVKVNIDSFSFSPITLTVPAGTTVTWINKGDVPRTVVSTDKVFASTALDPDGKFNYTFTKSGTCPYYC